MFHQIDRIGAWRLAYGHFQRGLKVSALLSKESPGGFCLLHALHRGGFVKPDSPTTAAESNDRQRAQILHLSETAFQPDHCTDTVTTDFTKGLLDIGLLYRAAGNRGCRPAPQFSLLRCKLSVHAEFRTFWCH